LLFRTECSVNEEVKLDNPSFSKRSLPQRVKTKAFSRFILVLCDIKSTLMLSNHRRWGFDTTYDKYRKYVAAYVEKDQFDRVLNEVNRLLRSYLDASDANQCSNVEQVLCLLSSMCALPLLCTWPILKARSKKIQAAQNPIYTFLREQKFPRVYAALDGSGTRLVEKEAEQVATWCPPAFFQLDCNARLYITMPGAVAFSRMQVTQQLSPSPILPVTSPVTLALAPPPYASVTTSTPTLTTTVHVAATAATTLTSEPARFCDRCGASRVSSASQFCSSCGNRFAV